MSKTSHLARPLDLRAPGAIDQLLAFHRSVFGDARMEEGGDGGASGDGAAGGADEGGDGSAGGQGGDGAAGTQWDGKIESLPTDAQKVIADLRKESAANRTKAKGAEDAANAKIQAALKALGIDPGGDDPVKAAQEAAETARRDADTSKQAARESAAELVVWRNGKTLGVDPQAVTDSRAFARAIADLDPASETFAEDVKKAATKAATDNPKLKAAQAAGQSSVDHAGGSGEGTQRTPKPLDQAVAGHYGSA